MPASTGQPACGACGSTIDPEALYCGECGAPTAPRAAKPIRQRLPWILSALALIAFAVALSLMIGEATAERVPGMPPTGAIIPSTGDPAGVDLSAMTAREAADRLFDRAMRTEAGGDTSRARFFAEMGIQAYQGLSPVERDLDARFHVGLLELMRGDVAASGAAADTILSEAPLHLLGWILRARVAEAVGDASALAAARNGFASAVESRGTEPRPEYAQHEGLIGAMTREVEAAIP